MGRCSLPVTALLSSVTASALACASRASRSVHFSIITSSSGASCRAYSSQPGSSACTRATAASKAAITSPRCSALGTTVAMTMTLIGVLPQSRVGARRGPKSRLRQRGDNVNQNSRSTSEFGTQRIASPNTVYFGHRVVAMRAPTCRAEVSERAPRITSAGASRCVRGWVEVSTRSCLTSIISEPLEGLSPGDDSGLREVEYCSTAATTDRGVPSRATSTRSSSTPTLSMRPLLYAARVTYVTEHRGGALQESGQEFAQRLDD